MKYKRILLKLSGEALMGEKNYGIDSSLLEKYSQQIKNIHDKGIEIAIVIGGGNIYRGIESEKSGIIFILEKIHIFLISLVLIKISLEFSN